MWRRTSGGGKPRSSPAPQRGIRERKSPAGCGHIQRGGHQAEPQRLGLMEQLYFSTTVSFRQAGKEKIFLKIYWKRPDGSEFMLQTGHHLPLEGGKFYAVIALLGGAMAVALILGGIALW